jgi:hypothetical protein
MAMATQFRVQLDSAADVHICGIRALYTGGMTELSAPLIITGVNKEKHLTAHQSGTILLKVMVNGSTISQPFTNVMYVPEYDGVIISLGVLSQKGCDVRIEGCRDGERGRTCVYMNDELRLVGIQDANSPRTYLSLASDDGKTCVMTSSTKSDAIPALSSDVLSDSHSSILDDLFGESMRCYGNIESCELSHAANDSPLDYPSFGDAAEANLGRACVPLPST